jgi:hypothetical protein
MIRFDRLWPGSLTGWTNALAYKIVIAKVMGYRYLYAKTQTIVITSKYF